ncbi:tyrosine-type recombinase/integrase [Blautia sp. MSJ-19]|uniref:tyrosine-type recombinase/integrase n=1 Tax=Blautia sp. MSJ-19 TaxID=2841517 RepID=UPI001C0EAC72|nr:tyrosine-type recombinase/integrase [Blautia sp. MSJ-19]
MKKNDKSVKNVVRGTKELKAEEILKYLEESGKVNLSDVQDAIEMKERRKLLDKHPYKITQGKDGKWRTYVKDNSKESGYRLIKKSTREKLDDALVEYYKIEEKAETEKVVTLDKMYWRWREVQDCLVVDNTVYKYTTDYNRFFKDKTFMQIPIEEITTDMLKLFFHDMIVDNGLSKGAFKKAYGYIDNTFQKAFREKVIPENPMVYLLRKQFYGYCEEIDKPLSKQVYTDEEVEMITQWLHKQYEENPSYIPHYAVELASLTGMRVGEIVALKWEDIHNEKGYFIIQRSEKFDRITKEYFIDKTKNKKVRNFPLDEKITALFTKVKKAEFAKGYLCEWIFANEEGRIHAPVVSSCIKNKCKQLRIPDRGIHAFRKTFNSNMRCAGVSEVVAASLLGHSPDVNKKYYTFDTTSLEDKTKIVKDAHARLG